MKRTKVNEHCDFYLDVNYWNNGMEWFSGTNSEVTPSKDLYDNIKGVGKIKELRKGKLYKCVRVCCFYNNTTHFHCYVIRNEQGVITQYHEEGTFWGKSEYRHNKLKELGI